MSSSKCKSSHSLHYSLEIELIQQRHGDNGLAEPMPDTSLISPFANMSTLQRGKIPSEGNVKYPDKSNVFSKNANLELKGGNTK